MHVECVLTQEYAFVGLKFSLRCAQAQYTPRVHSRVNSMFISQPRRGQAFIDTLGPVRCNRDHCSRSVMGVGLPLPAEEPSSLYPALSADRPNGAWLW
ncbi:hypothetical protein BD311DRAFT_334959 [Dichomitus squalens]|uniref:Uncharacterized protein n=1 Tax=Dichomitus squalens TaxID=114155 RepID=A0A4Q9ML01_9APHY|nr:hypothetical protein BD311DRAFT_334959 [Dichomitus squalens]